MTSQFRAQCGQNDTNLKWVPWARLLSPVHGSRCFYSTPGKSNSNVRIWWNLNWGCLWNRVWIFEWGYSSLWPWHQVGPLIFWILYGRCEGLPLQVRLTLEWLLDLDPDRRVRNIGESYGANCSAGIKPSKSKTKTTDNWGEHIIIYSSFEYQSYNKSYHYIPASYHPNLPWLRKREGKKSM